MAVVANPINPKRKVSGRMPKTTSVVTIGPQSRRAVTITVRGCGAGRSMALRMWDILNGRTYTILCEEIFIAMAAPLHIPIDDSLTILLWVDLYRLPRMRFASYSSRVLHSGYEIGDIIMPAASLALEICGYVYCSMSK
jgi:hypothetical protein